ALADTSAPTVAAKYDMLRGLLRAGQEEAAEAEARSACVGSGAHKYDLIYDLLQSVRTSGDPDATLAASDPKYDMVWSLLNMRAPTRGSMTKYDMVDALLQAALAVSPQPGKYDPLHAVLRAEPITGSSKYCIAEALLNGDWQHPLESGLTDLPSWDPLSSVVGAAGISRAEAPEPTGGRRTVNKYDMVGLALEAVAALPEDLASGKWAASQPRDLLFSPRPSPPPPPRQPPSKYDMVGQALAAAAALPEELSSGQWAASQGRELLIDTMSRTVDEGGWGVWRRVSDGGAAALDAVGRAASSVTNTVSKAMGMPYEVAPGVVVVEERPRSASPPPGLLGGAAAAAAAVMQPAAAKVAAAAAAADSVAMRGGTEEQPAVVFQFKEVGKMKKKAESGRAAAMPVGKKRYRGIDVGNMPGPSAATSSEPLPPPAIETVPPPAAPRLDRAVVPPLRGTGRRVASAAAPVSMPELEYVDNEALHAAIVESLSSAEDAAAQAAAEPAAAAAAASDAAPASARAVVEAVAAPAPAVEPEESTAEAAAAAAEAVAAPASAAEAEESTAAAAAVAEAVAAPAAESEESTAAVAEVVAAPEAPAVMPSTAALSDLAVDLLVFMSVQGTKGGEPPALSELAALFGGPFTEVVAQVAALRRDVGLLGGRHAAVSRLVAAASASRGGGKGLWSYLYDVPDVVRDAEAAMPAFLEDCRTSYPLVQGLLATGDAAHSVRWVFGKGCFGGVTGAFAGWGISA
ncbi:hypothetical protein PLESTM_000548500, partial [Pleodorina starrii]